MSALDSVLTPCFGSGIFANVSAARISLHTRKASSYFPSVRLEVGIPLRRRHIGFIRLEQCSAVGGSAMNSFLQIEAQDGIWRLEIICYIIQGILVSFLIIHCNIIAIRPFSITLSDLSIFKCRPVTAIARIVRLMRRIHMHLSSQHNDYIDTQPSLLQPTLI